MSMECPFVFVADGIMVNGTQVFDPTREADVPRTERSDRFCRNTTAGTLPVAHALRHVTERADSHHRGGRYGYTELCCDALVLHVEALQAFVNDLCEHHAQPMGPAKTAEHYQLMHRLEQLRQGFQPLKGQGVAAMK